MASSSNRIALPSRHTIYDLITSNNLEAIRSLLGRFTLHDRREVVETRVGNKSLLYHACEHGFQQIVKYLLDECGADIENGFAVRMENRMPILVAIDNLDISLIFILLKRFVSNRHNRIKETANICYAMQKDYYTISSLLRLYRNKMSGTPLPVRLKDITCSEGMIFYDSQYNRRSQEFLDLVLRGTVADLKRLLILGVDVLKTNDKEENALCLAILNNKPFIVKFFIETNIYSSKSYALALELCGAKFIIFRQEMKKGVDCWRRSLQIRLENQIGIRDKYYNLESDLGLEFTREEELNAIEKTKNDGYLYLQALLVLNRLVSRARTLVHDAFLFVSMNYVFKDDFFIRVKILSEMLEICQTFRGRNLLEFRAIKASETLISILFHMEHESKQRYLRDFRKLLSFFEAKNWELPFKKERYFYKVVYKKLLSVYYEYFNLREQHNLDQEEIDWINEGLTIIFKRSPIVYPSTLLHIAIQAVCPVSVVSVFLKCSADPNSSDDVGNTPLHYVSLLNRDSDYLLLLMKLLISAGGHVDSVNKYGLKPLEIFIRKGLIRNPLKYISLQCLAAKAINANNIIVNESEYPKYVSELLKIHSP